MKKANTIAAIILIAFGGFYAYLTFRLPERNLPNTLGSDFMPWLLVAILFVLSFWLLLRTVFRGTHESFAPHITLREGLGVVFLTLFIYIYVKTIELFGFIFITPAFLAILMWICGSREWKEILFVSIGSTFCIYVLFEKIFRVILPGGMVF